METKEKAAITAANQQQYKGSDNIETTKEKSQKKFSRITADQLDVTISECAEAVAGSPMVEAVANSIPTSGLRTGVVEIIDSVATATQSPRDYSVAALMTIAGAAAGKNAEIVMDTYGNYPCLWTVIVGDPSSGKTPPLAELMKPLFAEDKRTYGAYRTALGQAGKDDKQPKWTQE